MLDTLSLEAQKVISLNQKRLEKTPSLSEILKENPELRGFFRFVARNDLRRRAARLIAKKLAD